MTEFQPGDVVILKSGGRAMTVMSIGKSIDETNDAECCWHTQEGTPHWVIYKFLMLKRVADEQLLYRDIGL